MWIKKLTGKRNKKKASKQIGCRSGRTEMPLSSNGFKSFLREELGSDLWWTASHYCARQRR
jgi:hypothetical protein